MTRLEFLEMANALSYDRLTAVAKSVRCPVHQVVANVTIEQDEFTIHDACCEKLKPAVQAVLLEYKIVIQRKFLRDTLERMT